MQPLPTTDQLTAAARSATADWGLDVADLSLLSLSENAVFRVDLGDGQRRVLRLHRPGYNSRQEMDSELVWVESLRNNGIDAPRPLRAPDGDGYKEVTVATGPDDQGRQGSEVRLVGLIDWVDGVNLEQLLNLSILNPQPGAEIDVAEVTRQFARIGGLLGAIRGHGTVWDQPAGFVRRRWDADGLVGPDPLWGRFWEIPEQQHHRQLFAGARDTIHRRLTALGSRQSQFGLIHADLHSRNVMVHDDRMIVIDFDDAGFGWYIHDLAMALHPVMDEPWFAQVRDAMVEGYRSVHPLDADELDLLPTFLTMRSLMLVGWLHARPELGLGEHLPAIIGRAARHVEQHLTG